MTIPAREMSAAEHARFIDHAILKPEFTPEQIAVEIENGIRYGVRTVCVNPSAVPLALSLSEGTSTGVCVVVDFPFGQSSTASRIAQVQDVIAAGVDEIDIVANYGLVRGGRADLVREDLAALAAVCTDAGVPVKVILETDALTEQQIREAIEACVAAGVDFIKSSTGFYTGELQHPATGASDAIVRLMLDTAAGRCLVKGSGSVRDRETLIRHIDAGVDRLGVGFSSTATVLGLSSDAGDARY